MSGQVVSYRGLMVWHKAVDLTVAIYEVTSSFPQAERYGLVSQMRRAAVSIASNIAEGSRRSSRADFRHFLNNAFGSGAELETQLELAQRLNMSEKGDYCQASGLLSEVMKMLNVFIAKLRREQQTTSN